MERVWLSSISSRRALDRLAAICYALMSYKYMQRSDKGIARWGLRDKKYVLFAGELAKSEGIHYLVEAFKQLEDTAKTPNNFKLVIAGKDKGDADYVHYLRTISEKRDNIILIISDKRGSVIKQLIAHAYIFVAPAQSPADSDMLGLAMRAGLAPLVSDLPEHIAIVGEDGFMFQTKSIKNLADRLAYLLSRTDKVQSAGKRARIRAERMLKEARLAEEKNNAAEELISEKNNTWLWIWNQLHKRNH